jgi:hypothetical protein
VTEENDSSLPRGLQPRERYGAVRQLHRDDLPAIGALAIDPTILAYLQPVDARLPVGTQCVTVREGVSVVGSIGHRHARTHGVTGAKQGPEVGLEGNPQWSDEEMFPAAMPAMATNATDVARPGLLSAQRARGIVLSSFTKARLANYQRSTHASQFSSPSPHQLGGFTRRWVKAAGQGGGDFADHACRPP